MNKGRHYEAAACASLKHFKSDCFKTERVYIIILSMPRTSIGKASKALFKVQDRSRPGALTTIIHKSIYGARECCKPIIPSLLSDEGKPIVENVWRMHYPNRTESASIQSKNQLLITLKDILTSQRCL